jgi:hypothetical protein
VTTSGSSLTGKNFSATLGYAVSGNVTYRGTQSGQIYLRLSSSNCGTYGALGTSISLTSGDSFTINGVPPGAYTLQAWMDNQGNGVPNVINPSGSTSGVSVTNDLVRGEAITLNDPSVTAVSNSTPGPTLNAVSPTDQGVMINFLPVTNSSQLEAVTSYQVQWSASPSFTGTPSSYTYAANGSKVPWILNNGLQNFSGTLSNGTGYYFRARGVLNGNDTGWTYYGGSASPTSITIGAPSSNASTSSATGTVTLPATQASYGPLYVGFYNQVTDAVYASRIASPSATQAYSVNVPNGSDYTFFAILDQNNKGLIDIGDITTLNNGYSEPATIGGSMSPFNYDFTNTDGNGTPNGNNSTGVVTTQMTQSTDVNNNTTISYGLTLQVLGGIKLPVSVQLSSPSGVDYLIAPVDLSAYTGNGNARFVYQTSTDNVAPGVTDAFTLAATYSDGTSESVFPQVTGAGATYSDPTSGATSTVAATGLTLLNSGTYTPTQPGFLWLDPANPGDYTYSFSLSDSNGNVLWQIPSSASKLTDMGSSITQITWGTDPTNASNKPTVTSLTSGDVYTWSIQLVDSDGNTSTTQSSFKP